MIGLTRGKVAVEPMFDPDESPGGIIIPDMAKERCDQGIIKYVGEGVDEYKIGDHVLFSGYTGTTVRLEDEGILIIFHSDFIVCRIDSPDTDVPGLYFRDNTGEYWTATREMATKFIADSVAQVKIVGRKSNKPSYD